MPAAEPGPEAGDQPGEHVLEVDVNLEELAEILGEELELPNIEPKARDSGGKDKYTGITRNGPESLRHFRRTFKQALRRQGNPGSYSKESGCDPHREDRRYRSQYLKVPQSNAVILYMMDVSGSIGNEQKEIVRIESFWLDTWPRSQYENPDSISFTIKPRWSMRIPSSHPRVGWNEDLQCIQPCKRSDSKRVLSGRVEYLSVSFSDGDNRRMTTHCLDLLNNELLPAVNVSATIAEGAMEVGSLSRICANLPRARKSPLVRD